MLDIGNRISDVEYQVLDVGHWISDTWYWISDVGYRILDVGRRVSDADEIEQHKSGSRPATGTRDIGTAKMAQATYCD